MNDEISVERIRYIKLGSSGLWEAECIKDGIVRIGYQTQELLKVCLAGDWDAVNSYWLDVEKKKQGTATSFTNQTRHFFEDDGSTLWITFHLQKLYWCFMNKSPAMAHDDGDGVFRTTVSGWSSSDVSGNSLTTEALSGNITKLAMYQGTICDVPEPDRKNYITRKLNNVVLPEVADAIYARKELNSSIQTLFRFLTWQDFELLVDLIFSASGWRRIGVLGKTTKTLDLDLILPTTNERAFVQVKSKSHQSEFEQYLSDFLTMDQFDRMFYVFHQGKITCDRDEVTLIGPDNLSELILDSGLTDWLIKKAS